MAESGDHRVALDGCRPAPADRGRGLRRLLRLAGPRDQRRQDVPARRRRAHPQLAAPADRLPRPGRHGRGVGDASGAAERPAEGTDRVRADVRAEPAPRHRGRARLRGGRPFAARATRSRSPGSPTTSSASPASTTGAPATSRRGSTSRSARSSASPSPRRSRRGSRRSPPSTPPGSTCPARTPSRCRTSDRGPRRGSTSTIEVELNGEVVSRPPYRTMYWSPAQMLAHLTVNGASLRTGDLFASGTDQWPRARPAGLVPGAVLGRRRAVRQRRPHLPAGR